jgi:DGQHR domain-containing protein
MQEALDLVDPDPITYGFNCIRATQPIGDIFLAAIPFRILIRISHFDVRRVMQQERDVERYLGIQRPLEDSRVKSLSEYVNFNDASFPTSVILAIDEEFAHFDEEASVMTLSNVRDGDTRPSLAIGRLARVLDGQHRIAGLRSFEGETFDVPVTIFVGADISDQGHIFATINLEQTKVHKSLVYDLFSLARTRSPQKTCHNIAVALDRDKNCALYHRIKRLGFATAIEGRSFEPITQSAFVEALMPYLSNAPKIDRDILLRGKEIQKIYGDDLYKMPFRNLFIDKQDLKITEIVANYFEAIRKKWPSAWNETGRGMMLSRTNGFRALMRFLRIAYLGDANRELIPLNFFLHSMRGLNEDFVVVDRLVERSFVAYDADFAKLALFAFHLATSGNWHRSKWPDGKVAGWANEFIRTAAWKDGQWRSEAFAEDALKSFLDERIDGEAVTKRKVLTNYRYMLASAGVLVDGRIPKTDPRAHWLTDATQLFWDRQIFTGELQRSSKAKDFEAAFFRQEIYKLLGCTSEQGRVIALSVYRDYSERILPTRIEQLEKLRAILAA